MSCIIVENFTWNNNRLTLTFSKPHTLIAESFIDIENTRLILPVELLTGRIPLMQYCLQLLLG